MTTPKPLCRVLVVSAGTQAYDYIRELLPPGEYDPVTHAANAGEAKRLLLGSDYDIIIINTPLPDEFGTRLAQDICQHSAAGVLLLVKAEHFPDIDGRLTPQGVLVLSKPMSTQLFTQSLRLLCGTRERLRGLEKKNATIEEKMEEIRLVNRAKWLLIERLGMTEAEAHRYIEKKAMDTRRDRAEVAQEILDSYDPAQ